MNYWWYSLKFLAVGIWFKWFFSSWERKNCQQSWANSQNDNYFHSKQQPRTILSEYSCHFLNLLIFASNSFFLSMRKIMWLNYQHSTARGYVEHLRYFKMLTGSFGLNNLFYPFWNNISQSCQCHNGAKGAIHVQCPSRGPEVQ